MKKENRKKNAIFGIIMWALSLLVLYPLSMVVLTSFKEKREANAISATLPRQWMTGNYAEVLKSGNVTRAFFNSVMISVFTTLIILITAAVLSYAIVRRNTRFCRMIDHLLTFGIIAPFAAMPSMKLLQYLGLYGNKWGLIFTYAALYLPFSAMMFTSYIKGIPRELDEAAIMDGATGINLFVRVIAPLLIPMAATVGVLVFMWSWNELQIPLYLLNSSANYTLPLSVYEFYGANTKSWHLVCADVIIVSMPVILLYLFAQKYVISGMTAGAVKA